MLCLCLNRWLRTLLLRGCLGEWCWYNFNRLMHNPGRSYWNAVKHVFRYLAGTKDHDILFGPNPTTGVVGYTDSDFRRLCGQSQVNNRILFQIRQWSNLVEIETLGVHIHLNDRSGIHSCVRRNKESFMARSVGAHVSTSRLRLGSSCLQ